MLEFWNLIYKLWLYSIVQWNIILCLLFKFDFGYKLFNIVAIVLIEFFYMLLGVALYSAINVH